MGAHKFMDLFYQDCMRYNKELLKSAWKIKKCQNNDKTEKRWRYSRSTTVLLSKQKS